MSKSTYGYPNKHVDNSELGEKIALGNPEY